MAYLVKKLISLNFYGVIFISVLVCLSSCGEDANKKPKEFMDANMYPQAIALLESEIQKNPKNAQAHLLLGECKLVTNQFPEAERSFNSATVLQPDLGMKIGETAMRAAKKSINEANYKQSFQIISLAQKYDPKTVVIASGLIVDRAKELSAGNQLAEGLSLFKHAISLDKSKQEEVSEFLIDVLSKAIQKSNIDPLLDDVSTLCVQSSPAKAQKIGRLYFEFGSKNLKSSNPSLSDAINKGFATAIRYDASLSSLSARELYSYAVNAKTSTNAVEAAYIAGTYDKDVSLKSTELLLNISRDLYEKGDLTAFMEAYGQAKKLSPAIASSTDDSKRCLNEIYLYESGNRVQSIRELKELRNSSEKFVKKVSTDILSPPKIGRHTVNRGTSWKDLGWTGPMTIMLNDYEVTDDMKIVLRFIAKNEAKKPNKLMFGYRDHETWFPYIVDDNGKKSMPIGTFEGGVQEPGNSNGKCRNILFNKDESVELSITFPSTSEGARKFDFISPKLNGWQWEWSIKNINLK